MLKKLLWESFATATDRSCSREYEAALNSDGEMFLESLLFHAYNNVSYYHEIFERSGVFENDKPCLANFPEIPLLTKEVIRAEGIALFSKDKHRRDWFYNSSSGSTGEPVRFIQDRLFKKWTQVTSKYYYEKMLHVNERFANKVWLWAAQDLFKPHSRLENARRRMYNAITNTTVLDCTYLTETDMARYVRTINRLKPTVLKGYASALYEFCKFIEKTNQSIYSPFVIVSSAEMLHDKWREKIEDIFGRKVHNLYGSREVDGIAGECEYGLLHIFMFNNYVELVDQKGKQVQEGGSGRVIVTTLHNYSMPFIRYVIGDMAARGPQRCGCGCPLPTVSEIIGRTCCFFRKEDGTIIDDGYFMGLFAQKEWAKSFRIIQEDYRLIRILVVPARSIEDVEKSEIDDGIRKLMGRDCKVRWEMVDEIPRSKMGKYLYTQSLLSEQV